MRHDEPEKWLRLADRPWLVPSRPVVCVDRNDGDRVHACDRDRHPNVQDGIIDRAGYREGRSEECRTCGRRRESSRIVAWGELEEVGVGRRELHHWGRHLHSALELVAPVCPILFEVVVICDFLEYDEDGIWTRDFKTREMPVLSSSMGRKGNKVFAKNEREDCRGAKSFCYNKEEELLQSRVG